MKKFISIFLLLYITLPINAQDKTNELSGFIIHKQENGSNGSLDGANIFLIYAKDTLKTTSINGVFRFKPIKTGKAKLIITAIGCRKVEKELNDICTKWLYASSYYRRNLDKDPEYNEKIKELKYLLATIKNYLSEKTNYDNEIRQLSFDTTVTSTKKNQPKEKNLINNRA